MVLLLAQLLKSKFRRKTFHGSKMLFRKHFSFGRQTYRTRHVRFWQYVPKRFNVLLDFPFVCLRNYSCVKLRNNFPGFSFDNIDRFICGRKFCSIELCSSSTESEFFLIFNRSTVTRSTEADLNFFHRNFNENNKIKCTQIRFVQGESASLRHRYFWLRSSFNCISYTFVFALVCVYFSSSPPLSHRRLHHSPF